jgi:hypothetical protein
LEASLGRRGSLEGLGPSWGALGPPWTHVLKSSWGGPLGPSCHGVLLSGSWATGFDLAEVGSGEDAKIFPRCWGRHGFWHFFAPLRAILKPFGAVRVASSAGANLRVCGRHVGTSWWSWLPASGILKAILGTRTTGVVGAPRGPRKRGPFKRHRRYIWPKFFAFYSAPACLELRGGYRPSAAQASLGGARFTTAGSASSRPRWSSATSTA